MLNFTKFLDDHGCRIKYDAQKRLAPLASQMALNDDEESKMIFRGRGLGMSGSKNAAGALLEHYKKVSLLISYAGTD